MSTYAYSGEDRYYVDGLFVTDGETHDFTDPPSDERWSLVSDAKAPKSTKAAPAANENKE